MRNALTSLEDLEEKIRNRPWLVKAWHSIKYPMLRFLDFKYKSKKVKWFYQRGKRGWADCDWWDMHSYLIHIITPMLKELKEKNYGGLGYGKASTPEKWEALLGEMIEGFEAADRIIESEYPMDSYLEDQKKDIKVFETKMKIFTKWFFHLWD